MNRRTALKRIGATILAAGVALKGMREADASTRYIGRICKSGLCGACNGTCSALYDRYQYCQYGAGCWFHDVQVTSVWCGGC